MLTDSAYIQMEGEGPASVELGFSARYVHTPTEVADANDIAILGKLLAAMVSRIGPGFNISRY